MKERPRVSVIIPVYNAEKYLHPCLDSVINQTLQEIEIICVDDGSTDQSCEIIKQYAQKDPRVVIIHQGNNGAGAARNAGLAKARGETLSFLDADDFFELNMLEKSYQQLKNKRADFVVFDSNLFFMEDERFAKGSHINRQMLPMYDPFMFRALTGNVFQAFIGWAWDKLYDSNFVRETGLSFQEQRTTNDMFFTFAALISARRIAVVDEVLAHHRKNEMTSLSNSRDLSWYCYHDALMKLKEYIRSIGLYNELEQDYVNYCLHSTIWNIESLGLEAKEKVYTQLKAVWLDEFGLNGRDEAYFYSKVDYQKLLKFQKYDFSQYLESH